MATQLPVWKFTDDEATRLPKSELGMRRRTIGWVPGGKFKTKAANFSSSKSVNATNLNLYGVDGMNPAFIYDGGGVRFIETGMEHTGFHDHPVAIAILPAESLALGYESGHLMLSSLGDPSDFSVSAGAAEIAVGDEIVDLATQPNDVLAIFCRSSLKMLTGKTVLDMQLSTYSERLSMTPWTLQALGDSVFLTDDGVTRLTRVDQFGDFRDMPLSAKVKPLLDKLKRTAICSWVVATRNEYRLMFENGLGISIKFIGAEVTGISTFNYGRLFNVAESFEGRDRQEYIFAGDWLPDGDTSPAYVNRLERGDSFDGEEIEALLTLVYDFLGSLEQRKRFKKLQLEVATEETATMFLRAELDYDSPEAPAAFPHELTRDGGGGFYDLAFFSEPLWSEQTVGLTDHYLQGVGRNIALSVYSKTAIEPPHTLNSVVYHWSPRGRRR